MTVTTFAALAFLAAPQPSDSPQHGVSCAAGDLYDVHVEIRRGDALVSSPKLVVRTGDHASIEQGLGTATVSAAISIVPSASQCRASFAFATDGKTRIRRRVDLRNGATPVHVDIAGSRWTLSVVPHVG